MTRGWCVKEPWSASELRCQRSEFSYLVFTKFYICFDDGPRVEGDTANSAPVPHTVTSTQRYKQRRKGEWDIELMKKLRIELAIKKNELLLELKQFPFRFSVGLHMHPFDDVIVPLSFPHRTIPGFLCASFASPILQSW